MPVDEDEDANEGQQVVQVQDDDVVLEEENEISMNTIRDNIANALVT
jgi:hypothetical protein